MIWGFFIRLWRRLFPQNTAPHVEQKTPLNADLAHHSFRLKGAILDNLDRYFYYLHKLKNSDADAYGLMGRTGLHIMPSNGEYWVGALPFSFRNYRPAFGGVLLHYTDCCEPDNRNKIYVKFIYFIRKKASVFELRNGANLYEVTLFYTDENKTGSARAKKYGYMVSYRLAVTMSGEIILLKERGRDTIREKREYKLRDAFEIPSMRVDYPLALKEIARGVNRSPEDVATSMFCCVASATEDAALANARVMVRSGDAAASFNIDIKRTAYFFKDREPVIDNGKRKRIFHIVRAHKRDTRVGERFVKFHFRGLRQFDWNGYRVTITVPGLHHAPLIAADFEAQDHPLPLPDDFVTLPEAGKRIAGRLSA